MRPIPLPTGSVDTTGMSPNQRFILQVGIIGALFAYLIFWVTSQVSAQITNIDTKVTAHASATEKMLLTLQEQAVQQKVLVNVSRQMCVNMGKTVSDRNACFSVPDVVDH